jgi:hypothetical protein
MGLSCYHFASTELWEFEIESDSSFVVNVPPSVFHFVIFFVFLRALPLPTNSLNMMVTVAPMPSQALMGTTVPSLFFISTIMSAV